MTSIGDLIAAEALTWVGTPRHWQGRLKGVGCDCKGLIVGVAEACGRPEGTGAPALAGDYERVVDELRLKRGLIETFNRVFQVRTGDVLLLLRDGKAQHLAIATGDGEMVHCNDAVVKSALPMNKVVSVWRWKDLADG